MSVEHSQALTLRTYPYADNHKIAVFLTSKWGIVRGVAYGARGLKSRFGSSLEPLTEVVLTVKKSENQDLATIQNCEIIRPFASDGLSWEQHLHFSYFVELLMEFAQEQERHDKLFRLALAVVRATESPIGLLARWVELWFLQLEGVLPPLDQGLPRALALKARDFMKLPPDELTEGVFDPRELEIVGRFARGLIEGHLEKTLKTRQMLDQLL